MARFKDRADAGRRLAEALDERGVEADVVLGVPRGGLPVARPVADRLERPLDVIAARKIGAPGNPELAIGSVAHDGTVWLNERLIDDLGVGESYLETEREAEARAAREKLERYRRGRPALDLTEQRVLIVDDGVATGATTIACVRAARNAGASRVVLAVPVGPPDSIARLEEEADEVIALETPRAFGAVGQFYAVFDQVSDEAAMRYLEGSDGEG